MTTPIYLSRAATTVPAARAAEYAPLIRRLAAEARQHLGRRASRSRAAPDWAAVEAVRQAAHEHHIPVVAGWVRPGATLRQLAYTLIYRAAEAGVLDDAEVQL